MLSMDVDHPDIIDFINAKRDLEKVTSANISVRTNNRFFEEIHNARNKKILNELATSNWESGEPGMLYWDRVQQWHLLSEHPDYELWSTNPCQPKGEYVLTKEGFRKIEDITDKIFLNGVEHKSTPMFKTGHKEVYSVELENGSVIRMTDNHRVSTMGGDVELKNLSAGDKVLVDYSPIYNVTDDINLNKNSYNRGILSGWLVADGSIHNTNDVKGYVEYALGESEFEFEEALSNMLKKYDENFEFKPHSQKPETCKVGRIHKREVRDRLFDDLGITNQENKFEVDFYKMDRDMKLGFLRALFTCDGSSRCEGISTLYSIEKDFLYHIQRLLKEFGVYSTVTLHNSAKSYIAKDGKMRNNSATYKIGIYDVEFKKIGFLTKYKNKTLADKKEKNSKILEGKKKELKIRSIKLDGVEDVFDITVNDVHHYNTNGLVVHNCGEQPLPANGSCLLGSLNLSNFVKNPFTSKASIDWNRLEEVTRISVRGMNEVLDEGIKLHPLEGQRETAKKFRQIGIGILGLADMFIKMGVAYGSAESIKLSSELGKFIRDIAYYESIELAKEEGPYPAFDADIVSKSPYFKSLDKELQEAITTHGMRNSHVLSIAPTGSISTMWGISGGIEPIFANSYTRTTKSLASEGDIDYKVYTEVIKELMESLGITNEKDLPSYAITSHDIKPLDRIKVQAAWQNVIDSAISSTINLNENATIEDIKEIYLKSWEYGLKGVTVFRNNSWRTGILNTDNDKEIIEEIEEKCGT